LVFLYAETCYTKKLETWELAGNICLAASYFFAGIVENSPAE
jgi:hypothetical protein